MKKIVMKNKKTGKKLVLKPRKKRLPYPPHVG